MSQRVWEYSVRCDRCGVEFEFGMTAPAESIEPESLARLVDEIHAPHCTVDAPTGGRL